MPRHKFKNELIYNLKTKIRGGHTQGWNPNLEAWEKELLEKYGISTTWVEDTDDVEAPITYPVFKKVES